MTEEQKKARYIEILKEHGPDLFNILYGIVAISGWHWDSDCIFSPQGIVDLNNNLMRFHAIADDVITRCSNVYPSGVFPNLDHETMNWLERQKELRGGKA